MSKTPLKPMRGDRTGYLKMVVATSTNKFAVAGVILRLKTISESLNEAVITVPDIPNTKSYWHGGNLDDYDDIIAQKNGKYEYGPGLYVIDHYGTAQKYAKGSRKMYMVTIENGQDINDAKISLDKLNEFVDTYVIGSKRKEVKKRLAEYAKNGEVKAYLFNNMMVNEKAVKPSNTSAWREFLVENGIDYEIVNNPFGWGEKMCVLYNMKKIKKIQQIKPGDKIEDYDMLMESKQISNINFDLTTTGREDWDKILADDKSGRFHRESVEMSPDEYLERVQHNRFVVDDEKVKRYADKLNDGDTVPAPVMWFDSKYQYDKGISPSWHDGSHRVLALKAAGLKIITVNVIYDTEPS